MTCGSDPGSQAYHHLSHGGHSGPREDRHPLTHPPHPPPRPDDKKGWRTHKIRAKPPSILPLLAPPLSPGCFPRLHWCTPFPFPILQAQGGQEEDGTSPVAFGTQTEGGRRKQAS